MAGRGINKLESYVFKLEQSLQGLDPDRIVVHNLAVPGQNSSEVLARLNNECASRVSIPKNEVVLILGVGINDSKNSDLNNLEQFANVYQNIIADAQKWSSKIIVLGLTPVDETQALQYGFSNSSIEKYEELIKKICAQHDVTFLDLNELRTESKKTNIFQSDGIHLNKTGHDLIYKKLLAQVSADINNSFDSSNYLSKITPAFSEENYNTVKTLLPVNSEPIYNSKLFVGQKLNFQPDIIVGGPCVRKDIVGISLNTFYQVFMPLLSAQKYNVPCNIFLGIQEEIMLRPNKEKRFMALATELENFINNLADKLKVKVKIVNTTQPEVDSAINNSVQKMGLEITPEQSTHLFSLFGKDDTKPIHSELRTRVSERVLSCHNGTGLKNLFDCERPLIVEDLEQLGCYEAALKWEKEPKANFCAFLPVCTFDCTSVMFKGEDDQRLLLGKDASYYKQIYDKLPDQVLSIYSEVLRLYNLGTGQNPIPVGEKFFTETLLEISELIK